QGAETFQGGGSRLVWSHPSLDIRLHPHLDLDAQFFFNVPQDAYAPNDGAQPRPENVEPFQHQPPATAILTFRLASASRSHLRSAALSCLLPALVSVENLAGRPVSVPPHLELIQPRCSIR